MIYIEVLISLAVILIAALIFTNALEHLGERLGISEGVTGSLFAAIGTALPETMIPLLPLLFSSGGETEAAQGIGVGAILGAPLLLSTFAMFLIALTTIVRRKPNGELRPEHSGLRRDLNFFLIAFAVATIMLFLPTAHTEYRYFVGGGLVALYFVYILFTVRASSKLVEAGHQTEAGGKMYAAYARLPVNILTIILQTLFGLAVLVAGAEGFIHGIETISHQLGISALLLSLIIAPFATELPEKVNSVLWIRHNRDTLAFGNVTGAMVFQGSLLPAMGIMTTPWAAEPTTIASAVATLIAAFWLRLLLLGGHLKVWHLLMNGMLYMAYLIVVLWGG